MTDGLFDTTLAGIEAIELDLLGTAIATTTIDASAFGSSATRFRYYLSDGTSTLVGSAGSDVVIGGIGHLTGNGGAGIDTAVLRLVGASGAVSLQHSGSRIVAMQNGTEIASLTGFENLKVGVASGADTAGLSVDATGLEVPVVFVDTPGRDTSRGSIGNDIFLGRSGGGGAADAGDVFVGGGGSDTCDYRGAARALNGTTIFGFDGPADAVLLYSEGYGDSPDNLRIQDFIGRAGFSALGRSEVRYFSVGGQAVVQIDSDGDGTAETTFRLDGEYTVTAGGSGPGLTLRYGTNGILSGTAAGETLNGGPFAEEIGGKGGVATSYTVATAMTGSTGTRVMTRSMAASASTAFTAAMATIR